MENNDNKKRRNKKDTSEDDKKNNTENNKKDTQSLKYLLTFNNPTFKKNGEFTHEKIKDILVTKFKSIEYFCLADEIADTGTPHTHLFCYFKSAVRFSQIQKYFNHAEIETAKGTCQQNMEYISKTGKWAEDVKADTSVDGTFEEWGEMPVERQGARNDLNILYAMIKDGFSDMEIIEHSPAYMKRLSDIERVRQSLLKSEYQDKFRIMENIFIHGNTETGKSKYVLEKYGYKNVYRITNYRNMFDGYKGQNVIAFEEFNGKIPLQDMNIFLEGYPLELPCRYFDKQACYEKVYIISNLKLEEIYKNEKDLIPEVYKAFIRRIHKILHFYEKGKFHEYDTQAYMYDKFQAGPQILKARWQLQAPILQIAEDDNKKENKRTPQINN
jgi:predicted DNA-binding protein YlxM (UPF0122 family)